MSDKQKSSASQRIQNLEQMLISLMGTVDNMARDLIMLKEATRLLAGKVDAIVTASSRGETISDETLGKIMVEQNVKDLEEKVKNLVTAGVLSPGEQVSETSFVVGREVNGDGKVVNPRLQFALTALAKEIGDKIKGSKPGDVLTLEEGKLKFEVVETYNIQTPSLPQAQEAPSEQAASA